MAHNTWYRKKNKDEINKRRRERYNIESIGYPISSIVKKGKFLLINLINHRSRGSEQIEIDFRRHFESVLSSQDKLHLSRRYFIESAGNSVYVYVDSAIQNYSKDELIDFLGVYQQVLERGLTPSKIE